MSEAELHMMRARLRGGTLNAARRGELKVLLPVGLVYDPLDRVVLDPDEQVQHSLRLLFDTSRGPARPAPRSGISATRSCCFRIVLKAGRTGVSCIGSP